jgi:hypothetical protein
MTLVALVIIGCGLVLFFCSLPLIRRKVPKNLLYGVRIKAAYESDERWYEINEYGGRQIAMWSWVITGLGVVGFFVPEGLLLTYAMVTLAIVCLVLLVPAIQISRFARRTSRQRTTAPEAKPRQ